MKLYNCSKKLSMTIPEGFFFSLRSMTDKVMHTDLVNYSFRCVVHASL